MGSSLKSLTNQNESRRTEQSAPGVANFCALLGQVSNAYHPDVRAHWLDFSAASRDEPDNQGARDCYHSGDNYSPEKRARKRSAFFNTHWRWGGGGERPMAFDADRCAEIDPVVEPFRGIGPR